MIEQSRRFEHIARGAIGLNAIIRASNIASAVVADSFSQSVVPPDFSLTDFPKAFGSDRLLSSASELIAFAVNAKTAALMTLFQLFSPFTRDVTSIKSIQTSSLSEAEIPKFKGVRHRILALPAIAGIHALPFLDRTEFEDVNDLIFRISMEALDPSSEHANRETLEIIWQSTLAALIRTNFNWENMYFADPLVEHSGEICVRFLKGHSELFYAAVAAYQFLLTYERALKFRKTDISVSSLDTVRRTFNRLEEYKVWAPYEWFQRLFDLYKNINQLTQMLPQQSEVALGFRTFPREVADHFLLMRFYGSYLNFLIKDRKLVTPYMSADRAANNPNTCALIFTMNRDAAFEYWRRIRNDMQINFLAADINKYVDHRFEKSANEESRVIDRSIARAREIIQRFIPFRNYDEVNLYEQKYGSADKEGATKALRKFGFSVDGFNELAAPISKPILEKMGYKNTDELTNYELKNLNPDQRLVGILDKVSDMLRDHERSNVVPAALTKGPGFVRWLLGWRSFYEREMVRREATYPQERLVRIFQCGIIVASFGLLGNIAGLYIKNDLIAISGAALMAAGAIAFTFSIAWGVCVKEIEAMGGQVGRWQR